MNPLKQLRTYLLDYCHFADESIVKPLALWIAGTYLYETFDSYPYLVITARVKRAGKTRLSELIGFTCQMPFPVSGASAASLFRKIKDDKPTIIWDEAETLSSESSSLVRAFLNVGYRKGQSIPRATQHGVTEWPTYCPKVFVLIGDVYDTLKDRSITVEMQRGEPKKHFMYETAKEEGAEITENLRVYIAENLERITSAYSTGRYPFLTDRDEEIWRPIFSIGEACDSKDDSQSLRRISVDLATEKTNPVKFIPSADSEEKIMQEEYGIRLLRDLLKITKGMKAISSQDALTKLKEIDIAPWRKYMGVGLTLNNSAEPGSMSALLSPFGLSPKPIRMSGGKKIGDTTIGKGQKVFKGYSRKDLEEAARKIKIL